MLDALNADGFEGISDCQRGECGVAPKMSLPSAVWSKQLI
jgi:hypothetical protein